MVKLFEMRKVNQGCFGYSRVNSSFQFEFFDEDGSRCSETLSEHHFKRDLARYIPILFQILFHEVLT